MVYSRTEVKAVIYLTTLVWKRLRNVIWLYCACCSSSGVRLEWTNTNFSPIYLLVLWADWTIPINSLVMGKINLILNPEGWLIYRKWCETTSFVLSVLYYLTLSSFIFLAVKAHARRWEAWASTANVTKFAEGAAETSSSSPSSSTSSQSMGATRSAIWFPSPSSRTSWHAPAQWALTSSP